MGSCSFLVQLLVTGRRLRRFGLAVTILMLPLALGFGSALIAVLPVFWVGAADQRLRSGTALLGGQGVTTSCCICRSRAGAARAREECDRHRHEPASRTRSVRVCLGVATLGFFVLPGLGLGLRGTAAINLVLIGRLDGCRLAVANRICPDHSGEHPAASHRHRADCRVGALDPPTTTVLRRQTRRDRSDRGALRADASSRVSRRRRWHPSLRNLLGIPKPRYRRRALALLAAAGDREIADRAARCCAIPTSASEPRHCCICHAK